MVAGPADASPEGAAHGRRRKLAAILSADAAGFSRQMHEDEAGTHLRLRSSREIIDRLVMNHDGRVVGSAGDSVLADFPSVVEALHCAVDIQQVLRRHNAALPPDQRLEFRVGINLGDVIVDGADIYGDGVNIAARLQQLAEPGGILVSQTVHNHVRGKLDFAFEPLGRHRFKNIPEPIATFRVRLDGSGAPSPERPKHPLLHARPARITTALLLLLALAGAGLWFAGRTLGDRQEERAAPAGPGIIARPVIAVLPFANQSGDPSQEYLSDGITEDLIAALGRFSSLGVVGRGTTFSYKDKAADPARIERELGARYVVEGSVRRADQRVRISVQLTDTRDGLLLWSERYEENLADVFAVQDAIIQRLVGTLAMRVTKAEQERALAKPPGDLAAYDYVLRGHEQLGRRTRSGNAEAREFFRKAIELDPAYATAQAGLGRAYLDAALFGWTEWPTRALQSAKEFAEKAVELDDEDAGGHALLSWLYDYEGRFDLATAEIDRAIELNPGDPDVRAQRGSIYLASGNLDDAIREFEAALSFDPVHDPAWMELGVVYYVAGRPQDALGILERNIGRRPDRILAWAVLAAAATELGRTAQAQDATARVLRLNPFFASEDLAALYAQPARERLIAGFHRAGLP
ncbi:MAG TPA: adenylate/guanylate cyclase domain-containing protein [Geminicoccus sp.]|uniref:adenylate/guanylate cyclase domain-containing protein n=1 Tax=Geminicoccus sp. TaxID=2024832 RepID=UPI002BD38214|nr:adenylate/guanylate cyclase domain-containing protein [Geminicoccus sp.]HWL67911.1 adenylate/guanylate cyclase domain-containing protein [Geminicoccus sp.]